MSCKLLDWMSPKSWNQDCWEKYQQPQICECYNSNGRKRRGTEEPPMRVKEENEKVGLKLNIKKAKIMSSGPISSVQFRSVQSLCCVQHFATSWIEAHRSSLSITNSRGSVKLTSIELLMPSSHLILCHPLLLQPPIPPSIRVFFNESTLHMRWPNIGVSDSASVLPMNTQDWSPLGWTGWISLQSKGLSRVFSNTTVQKHQFFSTQLSL